MENQVEEMLTADRKREMVQEIKDYLSSYSHADFGRKVGITSQNAFAWQERGTFNAELIISKFPEISGDWLLTGRGPMLREQRQEKAAAGKDGFTPEEVLTIKKAIDAVTEEQRLTAKAQAQADRLLGLAEDLSKALAKLSPLE